MNSNYNSIFKRAWSNSFDTVSVKDNLTVANRNAIFSILNRSVGKLNLALRYQLDTALLIPKKELQLFEVTSDCNLLHSLSDCAKWSWETCIKKVCAFGFCAWVPIPGCLPIATAKCGTDLAKAIIDCNGYTRVLRQLITNIGTIEGNVHLGGDIVANVSNISVTSNTVMIPANITSQGASAKLRFSFIQNGLAGFLLCHLPIRDKILHFDLEANQRLPLSAPHELKVEHDSLLSMHLKTESSSLDIHYTPSVPELLLRNPVDLTMNCNMGFKIFGHSVPLAAVTSLIACKVRPDGSLCHFTKVFLDGLFKQLYTLNIKSKEKTLPLKIPSYHLDPFNVYHKYQVAVKYFVVRHYFDRQ